MNGIKAALCAGALVVHAGCHHGKSTTATDMAGSATDGATAPVDAGFQSASHDTLLAIPNQGGPMIGAVKYISISYQGSAFGARIAAFGDYVVTSDWYKTVGTEYGVLPGTHQHVDLTDPPPASIDGTGIGKLLAGYIASGTLPAPDAHTIYMYYSAEATTLTDEATYSCTKFAGTYTPAYHYEGTLNSGAQFSFGVVPLCDQLTTDVLELATAHELIEASTDPLPDSAPTYIFGNDTPWQETGGEVADICDARITRDGHTLTRVWSNIAALAGANPCIPADTAYFSVQQTPTLVTIAPGAATTFLVTGCSLTPTDDWSVYGLPGVYTGIDLQPKVDVATIGNGMTAHVTIKAPVNAQSGTSTVLLLYSVSSDMVTRFVQPVVVQFE
ncbi:MAG: hypothetical protein ABI321_17715 [Polyangia bacterium]